MMECDIKWMGDTWIPLDGGEEGSQDARVLIENAFSVCVERALYASSSVMRRGIFRLQYRWSPDIPVKPGATEFVARGLAESSWMVEGSLGACRDDPVSKPALETKLGAMIASEVHRLEKMIYEILRRGSQSVWPYSGSCWKPPVNFVDPTMNSNLDLPDRFLLEFWGVVAGDPLMALESRWIQTGC
ncbi:hypothetical protein CRG98_004230 [Punica granatum]|uniref:Uncharacterized protein n=1 Tax=Punica granatum TaxID=22663 RepID=A0A2I0L5D2_PUNGR|nr:hypothetical protein CRG98_004230 [Punica granatum]